MMTLILAKDLTVLLTLESKDECILRSYEEVYFSRNLRIGKIHDCISKKILDHRATFLSISTCLVLAITDELHSRFTSGLKNSMEQHAKVKVKTQ